MENTHLTLHLTPGMLKKIKGRLESFLTRARKPAQRCREPARRFKATAGLGTRRSTVTLGPQRVSRVGDEKWFPPPPPVLPSFTFFYPSNKSLFSLHFPPPHPMFPPQLIFLFPRLSSTYPDNPSSPPSLLSPPIILGGNEPPRPPRKITTGNRSFHHPSWTQERILLKLPRRGTKR